ncbi:hypothetical protein [Nocardia tengchongensis]|uniref:hypothetical protein n=1 Tax=Nocardia tengchongensis TaxID=2055889 RepID=UPI0036613A82
MRAASVPALAVRTDSAARHLRAVSGSPEPSRPGLPIAMISLPPVRRQSEQRSYYELLHSCWRERNLLWVQVLLKEGPPDYVPADGALGWLARRDFPARRAALLNVVETQMNRSKELP